MSTPDLTRAVSNWQEKVQPYTDTGVFLSGNLVTQGYGVNNIKLRNTPRRAVLAEVAGNTRKRSYITMSATNEDAYDEEVTIKKGKRGRPRTRPRPGSEQEPKSGQQPVEQFPPPASSKSDSPSKKVGGSPRKLARWKDAEDDRPQAAIDLAYLKHCVPSVRHVDDIGQHIKSTLVPKPVENLWRRLRVVSSSIIPHNLKVTYQQERDTPQKTKDPILAEYFQDPKQQSLFPAGRLSHMKDLAEEICTAAQQYYVKNKYEDEWKALVHELMKESARWHGGDLTVHNIERCAISPDTMKPSRGAIPISFDDQASVSSNKSDLASTNTIARMVDYAMGLNLDDAASERVDNAFVHLKDFEKSLNQTDGVERETPFAYYVEIKKKTSARDPDVQLAVWVSAAWRKMQYHDWDCSLPIVGITVDGFNWMYFLFWDAGGGRLARAGPYRFGSTESVEGIWLIYARLAVLGDWAATVYKQWFETKILPWMDNVAEKKERPRPDNAWVRPL